MARDGENARGRDERYRPQWQIRTPAGATLQVQHDRIQQRWRVTPGGYEARTLARALAFATGVPEDAPWVQEICAKLDPL